MQNADLDRIVGRERRALPNISAPPRAAPAARKEVRLVKDIV